LQSPVRDDRAGNIAAQGQQAADQHGAAGVAVEMEAFEAKLALDGVERRIGRLQF
jgi:hypothetical protein